MNGKRGTVLWKLFRTLLLAVLILNLITVLLSTVRLRERLQWIPYAALTVESGSMEPELSAGDLLLIHETNYERLQIGDDVTFHSADQLITHRIVGRSGNFFITQGLANNVPDSNLMGPEEYCGKVIYAFPQLGWVLDFLTAPGPMLLTALLILAGAFGVPAVLGALDRHSSGGAGSAAKKIHVPRRALVCAAAISMLLTTPFLTAAKYTAQINRYETVVSSAVHFSSNYLSESGNRYNIQGWTGASYSLTLSIKNYDNALLVNEEGSDLVYKLAVEKITDSNGQSYSDDYTVEITPLADSGVSAADESIQFAPPAAWEGYQAIGPYIIIGGESKLENKFQILVTPTGELPADTVIRFRVHACTSEQNQYLFQLFGDFTLKVAEAQSFIGETRLEDQGTLVKFSLQTNLISEGSATKLVKFQWDPTQLYINEFESSAYNVIVNWPAKYYDKEHGALYLQMQAYSSVNLQFFKKNSGYEPGSGSITARIVEEIT